MGFRIQFALRSTAYLTNIGLAGSMLDSGLKVPGRYIFLDMHSGLNPCYNNILCGSYVLLNRKPGKAYNLQQGSSPLILIAWQRLVSVMEHGVNTTTCSTHRLFSQEHHGGRALRTVHCMDSFLCFLASHAYPWKPSNQKYEAVPIPACSKVWILSAKIGCLGQFFIPPHSAVSWERGLGDGAGLWL